MRKCFGPLGLSSLALVLCAPIAAFAYTVSSEVTEGCHESITLGALSRLRSEHGLAPRLEPQGEDRALVDDLPFDSDTDLAGATLALGNRDVDLNGNAPDDLDVLAMVHGDPEGQQVHCLRTPDDNEPDGSAKALAACRSAIRSHVEKSLKGLGADGSVDPKARTSLTAVLDIRGPVDAALPTFYVEMGRALHTLQDAFSHTWRTNDHRRITTLLNYVDGVNGDYEESRDGPPHSAMLDECSNLDSFRSVRLQTAKDASVELMAAALAPAASDAERMARVDVVLSDYMELEPGCTFANKWCDAPETEYRDPVGCGCRASRGGTSWGFSSLALGLGVLLARRRRNRRGQRLAAWSAALGLGLASSPAAAQGVPPLPAPAPASTPGANSAPEAEPEADVKTDAEATPDPEEKPAPEEKPEAVCASGDTPADTSPDSASREEPFPLGVYVAGGGSLTHAAVAASIGARYRISPRFLLGADAEYNPWFSRTTKQFRSGTTNIYATLVVRFPMNYERVNVRSTLQLGISRINFALYGVPKGTIGPYVGFNLVGLEFEISRSVYLILDPAHIAIPIPQTSGVPFSYPQYRVTLGLQLGA